MSVLRVSQLGCWVPSQPRNLPPDKRERRRAESLYETEMLFREEGLSEFVYDEERDLFRFKDGRFFAHPSQHEVTAGARL